LWRPIGKVLDRDATVKNDAAGPQEANHYAVEHSLNALKTELYRTLLSAALAGSGPCPLSVCIAMKDLTRTIWWALEDILGACNGCRRPENIAILAFTNESALGTIEFVALSTVGLPRISVQSCVYSSSPGGLIMTR